MAGNSQRRGAIRKGGTKPAAGSGGRGRQALEGRGPTPKATEREGHPAQRRTRSTDSGRTPRSGGGYAARPAARSATGSGARPAARRAKESSEVVAGRNSVLEALRADIPASTLFLATRIDADDRVRDTITEASRRGIPILECPRTELDRITDGAVHQGVALQVPPYAYAAPTDLHDPQAPGVPLVVALDGVTDPRNLGAIVRSVAAFGGHGVVVPERRSVGMTAGAWKSSAGAAARIPVAKAGNLTRALEGFQKAGFFVVGLDMDGDVQLPALDLADQPLVVVVGSEGKGLSRLVRQTCDRVVSIPMVSAVESLNAGVATSVALYEIARQRGLGRAGAR